MDENKKIKMTNNLIAYPSKDIALIDGERIAFEQRRANWRIYIPLALIILAVVFSSFNGYAFWSALTPANDWGSALATIPAFVIAAFAAMFIALAMRSAGWHRAAWFVAACLMALGSFAINAGAMYLSFHEQDIAKLVRLTGSGGAFWFPLIAAFALSSCEIVGGIWVGSEANRIDGDNQMRRETWQNIVAEKLNAARARADAAHVKDEERQLRQARQMAKLQTTSVAPMTPPEATSVATVAPLARQLSRGERLNAIRNDNVSRNGAGAMTAADIVATYRVSLRQAQRDARDVAMKDAI